jgi:hypothetical protein
MPTTYYDRYAARALAGIRGTKMGRYHEYFNILMGKRLKGVE